MSREPRSLGVSLDRLTRSLGAPDARALTLLFDRWGEIVGDQVAAHARPLSLVRGTLVVAVDEPGWATQLTYLEPDLRARFAAVLGEGQVARLELRVRPW